MGYTTYFKLSTNEKQNEILENLLSNSVKELDYIFDYNGQAHDAYKWYEHEEDMREVSKLYPEVIFKLEGEGEEAGDVWIKYFKNGLMQDCPAKITFDEYDESKLK